MPRATARSSARACSAGVLGAFQQDLGAAAGSRCSGRRAAPSSTVVATSRFWVPSCSDRSMRRSSVACASRAAARVAVSSATRSDRSVSGPGASSRRPGRLQPRHRRDQPDRRCRPAAGRAADRDDAGPVVHRPRGDRGSGLALRQQLPPQREGAVTQRVDRQLNTPTKPSSKPGGGVPGQPDELAAGGLRRVGRLDDVRAPAAQPAAFAPGQGVQHPQPGAELTDHGGQRQQNQHAERQHSGAEATAELAERCEDGPGRRHAAKTKACPKSGRSGGAATAPIPMRAQSKGACAKTCAHPSATRAPAPPPHTRSPPRPAAAAPARRAATPVAAAAIGATPVSSPARPAPSALHAGVPEHERHRGHRDRQVDHRPARPRGPAAAPRAGPSRPSPSSAEQHRGQPGGVHRHARAGRAGRSTGTASRVNAGLAGERHRRPGQPDPVGPAEPLHQRRTAGHHDRGGQRPPAPGRGPPAAARSTAQQDRHAGHRHAEHRRLGVRGAVHQGHVEDAPARSAATPASQSHSAPRGGPSRRPARRAKPSSSRQASGVPQGLDGEQRRVGEHAGDGDAAADENHAGGAGGDGSGGTDDGGRGTRVTVMAAMMGRRMVRSKDQSPADEVDQSGIDFLQLRPGAAPAKGSPPGWPTRLRAAIGDGRLPAGRAAAADPRARRGSGHLPRRGRRGLPAAERRGPGQRAHRAPAPW